MHGNVPVRFGRGRLDSLGNKGLVAYLIAGHFGLRAESMKPKRAARRCGRANSWVRRLPSTDSRSRRPLLDAH